MYLGKLAKYRSWLYSAAIALLVTLWVASGQLGEETEADTAQPAATAEGSTRQNRVRVRTQAAEEVLRTISMNGETAPARIVTIAAETDGRVITTGAERGTNVDAGALIVRLDERDRRARLEQARAMVRQRELEYEARSRLKDRDYVSAAQLQEGLAALEAARAELRRAELDLDYMTIRAPFDGALQERLVEIGDFVSRGDPVATFVDNRSIIVTADVSEFDAAYVKVGQAAEARLATGERVRGVIRYVAPVADEATRTFAVELEVDNPDGRLRTGGTAELLVPAERVLAHRVSPSLLTLDDAGNVGVKIVDEDGRVDFVAADIALSSHDGVWLTGLPPTATIITVGQGFVSTGAIVDAVPESEVETAVAAKAGDGED